MHLKIIIIENFTIYIDSFFKKMFIGFNLFTKGRQIKHIVKLVFPEATFILFRVFSALDILPVSEDSEEW